MQHKPIIEIRDLNVTYFPGRKHEVRALQHVSLNIYPGEFIIFFGPSGCGKSTLLYSIAGLETHAHGRILVGGKNIAEMSQQDIAEYRQRKIGMIFQAFYLIGTLSVIRNVMLPQMAIGIAPQERRKRALNLLDHFGVSSQASKLPTELSGGQQQRVAISRALVNEPDIVLADEPVGNLDSQSAHDVITLIQDLNTRQKKTVILVTHDPSHLHIAHRVFYMRDGRLMQTKVNKAITPEVLTQQPEAPRPSISKDLELLIRTYTTLAPDHLSAMLIPFKAKEIVSSVLTGFSVEDVERIEAHVRHMMEQGLATDQELDAFLDRGIAEGGLGLDARTAQKLAEHIGGIVREVQTLQRFEREQRVAQSGPQGETLKLREYLLDTFHLELQGSRALMAFDDAITARLANEIDMAGFRKRIDRDLNAGGVGLDKRTARKVARHMELILLGRYTIDQKKP